MGRADVLALVARQDGLITDVQALDLGLTARTLRRRVQRDGWAGLHQACSWSVVTRGPTGHGFAPSGCGRDGAG
jgi:hypothetical protein